jgi:integral membrane sensor domain MASE1
VEPVLWLPSGLLGAVVSSSAVGTWAWLLPAGTIAEFLSSRFIAGGVWGADHSMVADALLALTTTSEAFLGGSLFRMWMQQRHPPATELILRGVFIVFVAVAGGAVLRTEIIGRLALDPRISIQTALAAPLLGSLTIAPLALALGFNARGHAGRSDGSQSRPTSSCPRPVPEVFPSTICCFPL